MKKKTKFQKFMVSMKKNWMLHLMALPAMLAVVIFDWIPKVGILMAFQKIDLSKGPYTSPWVGLKNFEFLFASKDAWEITRNTVFYNATFLVLTLVLSMGFAMIISELRWKRTAKTLQTMLIMPHFLSIVAVSMAVYAFLRPEGGFVNSLFGLGRFNWYGFEAVSYWPYLLTFIHLWQVVGYQSIVYTGVIAGISPEYYEAAAIDGASKLKQAWYITMPHLRTIMCLNLIRSIGNLVKSDFGLFYNVPRNSGALLSVTQTLDTYIYRGLSLFQDPNKSTAAGVYQSIIGLILVCTANYIIDKIDSDSAMF